MASEEVHAVIDLTSTDDEKESMGTPDRNGTPPPLFIHPPDSNYTADMQFLRQQ